MITLLQVKDGAWEGEHREKLRNWKSTGKHDIHSVA